MMIFNKSIPRRTFLRGAGATLALPFLDAMMPVFGAISDAQRPTRLSFIEVPNGIIMDQFTPTTEGTGFKLTPVLEPLAPFKDRMLVLGGLSQNEAAKLDGEIGGDHPRACTAFLTGTHAKMTSGADLQAGISVDQVAAREFKKHTQLASLEVGLESAEVIGACESAYSCAYYNTVSWLNETTPLPMENRPRVIFERMFGDSGTTDPKIRMQRMQENKSILDAVVMKVKKLREKLPHSDRGKIDQYLDAIRDVERRIQLAEVQSDRELPEMAGPVGTPNKFSDYYKLMVDLQVLAWQSDLTRVCTFQIGHEMSNRAYPELGFGDSHHSVTHHTGNKEKIAKTIQVNIFHAKMLSYFLDKLQSTQDGEGSLLDHSMLMYGSSLSDGNLHIFRDLPILLFAGGVKGIKGGIHKKYPSGTPMNNLFLTMLDKVGVEIESMGDSTGKLALPSV
ncbi:MAG: DUF1552 domain-containing protein [Gammaproteobacteria bacterium]|jgi:hypothetical protein